MRKIAYLYDLPSVTAQDWGCDVTFVDYPKMRRADRAALVDGDALRPGDVVVVCKLSQLGQGRESTMIQQRINAAGASIEVIPLPKLPPEGRKGWLRASEADIAYLKPLWQSSEPASYVLRKAGDRMGRKVNLSWLNRWLGNRFDK